MSNEESRTFEDKPAVREPTPLLVGLVGPSGTGKTMSALRLATGIQRVVGGEIFYIDTENRRSLHYAESFNFRHVHFGAPFGSLAYLAAIEHCIAKGARTIVVDSMSHEHEGPGGVLEQHATETTRLAKAWKVSEDAAQMSAWAKPKAARRRMINTVLQMNCNMLFCFRAKEKLLIKAREKPVDLGFMPLAGEEFVYEFMARFLLKPGADGHPTWQSELAGEVAIMKLPAPFRAAFKDRVQLSEDIGEMMARWSTVAPGRAAVSASDLAELYEVCDSAASLANLETRRAAVWKETGKEDKVRLVAAADAAKARLATAPAAQVTP